MHGKPIPSIVAGVNNIAAADSLNQVKDRLYNYYQDFFKVKDVNKDDFYPIFLVNRENIEIDYNVIDLGVSENDDLQEKFREKCREFHRIYVHFMRNQIRSQNPTMIRPVLVISAVLSEEDEEFADFITTKIPFEEGVLYWDEKEESKKFFTLSFSFIKHFRDIMERDFNPFVVYLSPIYTVDFASYVYQKGVNFIMKAPKLEKIVGFSEEFITALRLSHFDIPVSYDKIQA